MLYIEPKSIVSPPGLLKDSAVLVDGDRIVSVGPSSAIPCPASALRLKAGGLLLAPGFIDLQINGAFGSDFTADPHAIWDVASLLPRYGVTSFLPTIISSPREVTTCAQKVLAQGLPAGFKGAIPLGLHLEGPFLNPEKRGAHDAANLTSPDPSIAANWAPAGNVRMVTLAPELPEAIDLVRTLAGRGVIVSAGHSMATYEQGAAAIEAGITYGTHLFNAMAPLDHREPGLAGALLADPAVTVGLIVDGIHLHPEIVALIWKVKGPNRVSLVTDAMAALGMPPGTYRLGERDVSVQGAEARLPDGRLAGSVLSLDEAVRNLVKFTGCTLLDALSTVTTVPASLLGMESSRGRIAPGCIADLVLLDSNLRVVQTVVAGSPYEL
jgi:N-acetylglucosamine-6-phosphate deacetylase